MKTKIFYIEDEKNLGKIVKETLERRGYEVLWEKDGAKVMHHFVSFEPDVCVLDIMLPHVDGYTLCEQIRTRNQQLPIIFLTAKTETEDLLKGFKAGGTDYMKKPFSMEELIARIENQMVILGNKQQPLLPDDKEIELGDYRYFPHRYELVAPSGNIHKLSQREKEVLHIFAASKNRIIDRKQLLLEVWGDDSFYNSRNLDVYIRKLRKYFQEDEHIEIQTLKGKGYLFLVR